MTYNIRHGSSWVSGYGDRRLCFTPDSQLAFSFESYREARKVWQSLSYLADSPLEIVQTWEAVGS